jgi:hypothetical protein
MQRKPFGWLTATWRIMMDEAFVSRALEEMKLDPGAERVAAVTVQLQRIEQIAAALDTVELDPAADEMAPVWRP